MVLVVVYVSLALTFSLSTRAWEADDEVAHTQYIEYIVKHQSIPRISVANNIESHQPPLYYLVAAGWQSLLGIPAFTPNVVAAHYKNPYVRGRLADEHNYTASQHREAIDLHELRLLSILLGLGTVLLTYAAAKVIGMRESAALCSGLLVALLPRELVVSSSVTNDALVIPLCSLALLLFLLAERARTAERFSRRRLYVFGMGLALGAAATAKFNSLPVAAILILLVFVPSIRLRLSLPRRSSAGNLDGVSPKLGLNPQLVMDGVIAILGFLVVSGWWFVRNKSLYGQFLATSQSQNYLRGTIFLHPVPWSLHMFLSELPATLRFSMWYLQPNLVLPTWMNSALSALALLSLAGGAWVIVVDRRWLSPRLQKLQALSLLGCIVGGVIAVVLIIKSVGYSDARLAYVGLSAFAIVVAVGVARIVSRINPRLELVGLLLWPTILFAVDVYVLHHYLVPLGGL